MKTKTEYQVVNAFARNGDEMIAYANAVEGLEMQVDFLLESGWKLEGGVSVHAVAYRFDKDEVGYGQPMSYTRVMACQAMTRTVDVDE